MKILSFLEAEFLTFYTDLTLELFYTAAYATVCISVSIIYSLFLFNFQGVLVNKGDIDAIFGLVAPSSKSTDKTRFHEFKFDPVESIVLPGGHQSIEITFHSEQLGKFQQDFFFNVDGSPEQLKLTIT